VKSNLVKRGFLALLVTQFFGAANDNVLKQVLIFMVGTGVWAGQAHWQSTTLWKYSGSLISVGFTSMLVNGFRDGARLGRKQKDCGTSTEAMHYGLSIEIVTFPALMIVSGEN